MVLNRFYTNEKVGGWVRRKALGEWVRQCDGCRRFDPEKGFPAGGAGLPFLCVGFTFGLKVQTEVFGAGGGVT
ncbi:MAG: hypothetical protein KIPDCIKN_02276 [Haliscomenobacter sp.]|jgi:hypothetical protein|nr:hypothetical protein [Haliscomenobacter sp.]